MAMFDPHSGKLQQVREVVRFTPLQQDVLKFLALVLMVVDHTNRALGLHEPVLLLLGRGAFPLFALLWGYNLAARPILQAQATRLWLWAVVAQPGYALVMQHDGRDFFDPNILFLFAVVTQALVLASRPMSKGSPNPLLVGAVLLVLWGEYGATDGTYGIAGVLVLLASYGLCVSLPGYVTAVWPLLVLMLNAELGGTMMLTGLLLPALLILGTLPLARAFNQRRLLPRGFFLFGYVGHLLMLALIAWLVC
ncbi:TPA: F-pilin acetylation protein TraX [Serratia marcescens]|uniref:TraX family protein n=1 Tax=Serratia marcescens TaxID=615 RepID=UPI0006ECF4CD|nr:TraX family protein [Serratia marcescens]ALL40431.1 F-pilin acetylation protein TraX [Serratia marcescens]HCU0429612.1 F-pilin acetylation protein TraX [Serratia marcescens]